MKHLPARLAPLLLAASILGLGAEVRSAWAHGGQFGGPPPKPATPVPPPPPPPPTPPLFPPPTPVTPTAPSAPPLLPPGPPTPSSSPGGPAPTTPGPGTAPSPAPGSATPPTATPSTPWAPPRVPGRSGRGGPAADTGGWQDWWDANGAALIGGRGAKRRVTTDDPLFRVGSDGGNRSDAERPTVKAIDDLILPTLRWAMDAANGLDADGVTAAHLAMGKTARGEEDVARLLETVHRRRAPALVEEGATLSLGLLRRTLASARFDGRLLDRARGALFSTIDDDSLPTRTRCFAALAIGLLGDQGSEGGDAMSRSGAAVVRGLWLRLEDKHVGEDLPVALLVALSLQPPQAVPTGILDALRRVAATGNLRTQRFGPLTRAQALLALARLSDSTGAGVFLGMLRGRTASASIRRAAVISLGVAAPRFDPDTRREAAATLCDAFGRGDDPDTLGLMLVSLARLVAADAKGGATGVIDVTAAEETILRAARSGRADVRPFAALALGIAGHGTGLGPDARSWSAFRQKSIGALREGAAEESTDPAGRGAFCIGLGLLADEGSVRILSAIAQQRNALDSLRGFACLSLGLVGRATPEVVATLKSALKERSSEELRRHAAAGLGHLGDVSVVPLLLEDLESGGSDHVLAQVVLALGSIGDARAVPSLVRIVKDAHCTDHVRTMAVAGLGILGDLEPVSSLSKLGADSNYLTPIDALYEALSLL